MLCVVCVVCVQSSYSRACRQHVVTACRIPFSWLGCVVSWVSCSNVSRPSKLKLPSLPKESERLKSETKSAGGSNTSFCVHIVHL